MTTAIPLPSEHKTWPAFFYPGEGDPCTVEGRVFARHQDVPHGWVHSLGHVRPAATERAPAPALVPKLDRGALKALLDELGEVYAPNSSLAALQKQYDDAVAIIAESEKGE